MIRNLSSGNMSMLTQVFAIAICLLNIEEFALKPKKQTFEHFGCCGQGHIVSPLPRFGKLQVRKHELHVLYSMAAHGSVFICLHTTATLSLLS